MTRIYLDYNASTPLAPEALDAMRPFLEGEHGNPSSGHWASVGAAQAITEARSRVASLLGASADEVVFTSGGSEASNWAIKGCVLRHLRNHPGSRPKVICTAVEHPATLAPCRYLEAFGAQTAVVPVDATGRVDPAAIAEAIDDDTVLVSVMHANNEVGTIQPIAAIAEVAQARGVAVHCDAAQSVGKIAVRMDELGVDWLSVAGHKLYAPKGVGALVTRRPLDPLIHGGGHEGGRRAGTENTPYVVALGAACALAERDPPGEHMRAMRDRLWAGLTARFGERVRLHGHPTERLPNTLNVGFVGRLGPDVLAVLDGVAASTGSACHAGQTTMSPVLQAMGVPEESGFGAVRFSTGRATTAAEIDAVLAQLGQMS